jgi:hypothetical protein
MLRVAMATVTCVAGCGGAPASGKNSVPVEPEVARAVAFIEQPGAQSQADVDWDVIAKLGHIRFLTGVDPERGVTDQDRKSFADRLETLARTDYEAEAAREAKAFVDGWKGAVGCTGELGEAGALVNMVQAELALMPPQYAEAAREVFEARPVYVQCGTLRGFVAHGSTGKVVGLDVPEEIMRRAPTNEFAGYMNQPEK